MERKQIIEQIRKQSYTARANALREARSSSSIPLTAAAASSGSGKRNTINEDGITLTYLSTFPAVPISKRVFLPRISDTRYEAKLQEGFGDNDGRFVRMSIVQEKGKWGLFIENENVGEVAAVTSSLFSNDWQVLPQVLDEVASITSVVEGNEYYRSFCINRDYQTEGYIFQTMEWLNVDFEFPIAYGSLAEAPLVWGEINGRGSAWFADSINTGATSIANPPTGEFRIEDRTVTISEESCNF